MGDGDAPALLHFQPRSVRWAMGDGDAPAFLHFQPRSVAIRGVIDGPCRPVPATRATAAALHRQSGSCGPVLRAPPGGRPSDRPAACRAAAGSPGPSSIERGSLPRCGDGCGAVCAASLRWRWGRGATEAKRAERRGRPHCPPLFGRDRESKNHFARTKRRTRFVSSITGPISHCVPKQAAGFGISRGRPHRASLARDASPRGAWRR